MYRPQYGSEFDLDSTRNISWG